MAYLAVYYQSVKVLFASQKVVRSRDLKYRMGFASATTKVFSANFLAVATPPKVSSAKVLCYTVGYFKLLSRYIKG